MDPTASWDEILELIEDGYKNEAIEMMEELERWLNNGGVPPEQFTSTAACLNTLWALKELCRES